MAKLGIGAVLAAVAMFMWGFLFWGAGIVDPFTHLSPEGETAIADAIRANTAKHGLYVIPDMANGTPAEVAARAATGPFAMLHVKPDGASMEDPMVMGMGFLNMLVTAVLLGLIMQMAMPATPGWFDRFKLIAMIGLTATIFGQLSTPIWWHEAWGVAFLFAAYDFVAYLLAGAILAYFVKPS